MPRAGGIQQRGRKIPRKYEKEDAKRRVLEAIRTGRTVASAVEEAGRSIKTYELWRKEDEAFRTAIDVARATIKASGGDRDEKRAAARDMGFAAFRTKYLRTETAPHQQQWVDLVEGRDPSELHEQQSWTLNRRNRVVVNCPPFHGKSVTISMDYVVYRICCNPNVRIKIISATQMLAAQFLYGVKHRLTHPNYKELQLDFAPEGGFEAAADSWKQDQIYLGGDRDTAEKDPTVQALGIGGQLYGARCDLIILDDVTDLAHAGEYRKQFQYITQEVNTRVGPSGMVLCVGTRVAPVDIYSELLNADNYQTGRSPWSYLSQPAILAESDDTREWDTLWPKARASWWEGDGICDCGMPECEHGYPLGPGEDEPWFPRWDGVHLAALRDGYDARTWALVFMQSSIPEDATFPAYAVNASLDGTRRVGALQDRHAGDLSDLYFIGGLDPATSGQAGAVVYAVDRHSGKRFVVDARVLKGPSPRTLKNLMKDWSVAYPIRLWAVDKTGLNTYFVQDDELRSWLTSRGIILHPHYISSNKWDPTFGIASMAPLFGSWEVREGKPHRISDPLVSLPRPDTEGVKALIQQLQVWSPEADPKKIPQDVLMALWFVEVQARKVVRAGSQQSHFRNSPFHSKRDIARRAVIDLNEWRMEAS